MESRQGIRVLGAAGHELGKLLAWGDDGFVVERGWLAPQHFVGTREQIAELHDGVLRLRVDRLDPCELDDAAGDWGYTRRPAGDAAEELAGVDDREWYAAEEAGEEVAPPLARSETRIPLHEDEVSFGKRLHVTERIRVRKVVRTEERTVVVPVRREEVVVERLPVTEEQAAELERGERINEPRVTVIPVFEDEVEVRTRPVVREEVRITRTFRRAEQREVVDARREVAEVSEPADEERR